MTLGKILTDRQDELLREERTVLARLRAAMARFDAAPEHQAALDRSIEQLDELFLLVIVGEFNAGKSAFINALLGSRVVEEGVTPTTSQINILQFGERSERHEAASGIRTIAAPVPLLQEIRIVDTPGTNAIVREHEAITREFVPRSDLVLFVTSADRPFTETERAFMEQVRGWGKKILVVINKVDILDTPRDVDDVRRFVGEGARTLLGSRFLGAVLNKVPLNMIEHVKTTVRPFLEQKGIPVFGTIPKDGFLESVSVSELNEMLGGKVLCCEDRLHEFVENFLIGAMDVDSALNYFRRTPNKAVITGAHRSDIQLAALETSTKCIILTGGLRTNEVVLGKAQSRGVPILSVPDDTFSTINKIELRMGKTSILESKKMDRTRELFSAGFDMYGFLKKLDKV